MIPILNDLDDNFCHDHLFHSEYFKCVGSKGNHRSGDLFGTCVRLMKDQMSGLTCEGPDVCFDL